MTKGSKSGSVVHGLPGGSLPLNSRNYSGNFGLGETEYAYNMLKLAEKFKDGHAPTQTKTNRKKGSSGVKNVGADRTSTVTLLNNRKLSKGDKKVIDREELLNLQFDTNSRVVSGVGRLNIFDAQQAVTTNTQGVFALWRPDDISQLNILLKPSVGDSSVPLTRKIFLQKGIHELRISNSDLGTADITIYDVVPRENISDSATNQYSNPVRAIQDSALFQTENTNGTPYYFNYNSIGTSIYKAENFTQNFRVVKSHKISLPPGASHQHSVISTPNLPFRMNRLADNNIQALRNKTCFTILAACGQVGHATGSTGGTLVTGTAGSVVQTSAVSLDIISTFKYKARAYNESITKNIISTSLLGTGQVSFVDEKSGADVADVPQV